MDAETRKKIESLGKACGEAHLSRAFLAGAEAMEAIMREREAKLVAALTGFKKLLDDEVLVRNTDHDNDFQKFLEQGARIMGHLTAVETLLAEHDAAKGEG